MKYFILLADGMADYPLPALNDHTPLERATTPHMDRLSTEGYLGLVDTIPRGMNPGSDIANLTILGYDAQRNYPGRGPLEAANMGIHLGLGDVAFRCNLVTLGEGTDPVMVDFTAGHISSDEARELIGELQRVLGSTEFSFHAGVGYRHLCVWHGGEDQVGTTPPHDITGQSTTAFLPHGEAASRLIALMQQAREVLQDHPLNKRRRKKGVNPANAIWLWGQGRAPNLHKITDKYGIRGGMISAVDLLNGIGLYAGLQVINVPGITGYIDTNFRGKGEYAVETLKKLDFVFVHVEAPDEMGHEGNIKEKIRAIERIDQEVLGTVLARIGEIEPLRILVLSDHPTPITLRTHAADPSPFVLWSSLSREQGKSGLTFSERNAQLSGNLVSPGYKLMDIFFYWDRVHEERHAR